MYHALTLQVYTQISRACD